LSSYSAAAVKSRALSLGFSLVGLTRAAPAPHLPAYLAWIEAGRHGEMDYLARADRLARRRDLGLIVPGATTLIVVGVSYAPLSRRAPALPADETLQAGVATYAWGLDYHDHLLRRLEALAAWLKQQAGGIHTRAYVDTGAILERDHAQQAGLGFIGKNTMLIHPRWGSDLFLGEILTDLEMDAYDLPHRQGLCGTCARCLEACPTGALVSPYNMDARRCISYLTIEHSGSIDTELRPRLGRRVFGCDACREVCPWQRFVQPAAWPAFQGGRLSHLEIEKLLGLDRTGFDQIFGGTAVRRTGRDRLVRNACLAAGNSQNPALIGALRPRLADASPLVRGHAAWAIARLAGRAAAPWLQERLSVEADPGARGELLAGLLAAALPVDGDGRADVRPGEEPGGIGCGERDTPAAGGDAEL
jgi:epoxyqueuosine reductase